MSEWRSYKLSELAEIRVSNVDKKSYPGQIPVRLCNYMNVYSNDYIRSDIDFMQATASLDECARFKVSLWDVMITKDSETPDDIGISAVVIEEIDNLICGYHLALIKPNLRLVNPIFLAKQLSASKTTAYFGRTAAGSTRYGLSNSAIGRTLISLPPREQQDKISEILKIVDLAIEKTEALIGKYQQIKAGLMHDLFTRGLGKDSKVRPPRDEAPGLYKQTPIGWLPTEWDIHKVADVVRSAEYGISTSLNDDSDGIPVLRMNNIQLGQFDVSDMKYSNDPAAFSLTLRLGDVLYNRTNSMDHVGKAAIWHAELPNCSFASYLVRINLWRDQVLPQFFSYWLNQPSSQISLRRFATPAVQQVNINPTNLQRVIISFPKCLAEQKEIVERIDAADKRIDDERRCVDKLIKEKAGLMHDLLTGKVTVKAAEAEHV